MKGIILAGGQGTRLRPFTKLINKHLLPVYNRPLIHYPIRTFLNSGIKDIFIVTEKASLKDFKKLLGTGEEFGTHLEYASQEGAPGIAHALGLAEKFAKGSKVAVMLGDNIFTNPNQIKQSIDNFKKEKGAKFFLKEVQDPERFGIAHIRNNRIRSIIEKPKKPKSNLAVTGLYLYDPDVFNVIKTIKPSARGELEITDVNNHYVKTGRARFEIIDGDWIDAGTFDSLLHASVLMLKKEKEFPHEI